MDISIRTLKVDGSLPGQLTFEVQPPTGTALRFEAETELKLEDIEADRARLEQLLPANLTDEIRQWGLNLSTPGLLTVIPANSLVEGIPWEHLPKLLKLRQVLVVRELVQQEPVAEERAPGVARLLAAGWSGKPVFNLPGIQDELAALSQLGTTDDFQVQVLFEQSLASLTAACEAFPPDILHLVPAAIDHRNAVPGMFISGGDRPQFVSIDAFLSSLPGSVRPRLVVLNTCKGGQSNSGPSAIRMIAEHLQTMSIGWLGDIYDRVAVDFARFLYSRILDGATIADALLAYRVIQPSSRLLEQSTRALAPAGFQRSYDPTSVVWTPSIALLTRPLRVRIPEEVVPAQQPKSPVRVTRSGRPYSPEPVAVASTEPSLPTLTVDFELEEWLNPALLKNGQQPIKTLTLETDRAMRNVEVAVSCDTGHGSSTVRETYYLPKGDFPVNRDTWQFPALYELIGAGVSRRQINFTVCCSLGGELLAACTRSVQWMCLTEWLDQPDTWRFIPAFVDPDSDGVLDVVGTAAIRLEQQDPTRRFDAYQSNDPQHVAKQVQLVFDCLRGEPYELHYVSAPPRVYVPNNMLASGQRVRRPTEVVTRRRGTCHDLAILFASCLENLRIYPLVILVTGHTFVGFWKDSQAHEDFWRRAESDQQRLHGDPGRLWTIRDPKEIRELLDGDAISLVDVVMVTDRKARFEDAEEKGRERFGKAELDLDDSPWGRFDVAVDIQASRHAIQPL